VGYFEKVFEARGDINPSTSVLKNPAPWLYSAFGVKPTATGKTVTSETALESTPVWNAIWIIATTIGSLPLPVFQRLDDDGKIRAYNHPLYKLLHDTPNRYVTSMNYRVAMMLHLLTRGNHYAEIEFNRSGLPVALWPIHPDKIRRVGGKKDPHYEVHIDGIQVLKPEQVLHIPGMTINGVDGYSPIRMAKEAISLGLAIEEYAARFYANNAKPSLAIKTTKPLSKEARDRLKNDWQETYGGLSNAHRTALLEEGMDVANLGIPQEDAQFLETRRFQVEEVARIFNLPPHMLKEMTHATFSNIEHQFLEFHTVTLRPWLVNIEQVIKLRLFGALLESNQQGYFAEFVIEGMLRGDTTARGAFYKDRFWTASITPNEIRIKENENPLPGGDQLFYPANMVPMGGDDLTREFKFREDGSVKEMRVVPVATAYGPDLTPGEEVQRGTEYRATAPMRKRIRDAYHKIFVDTAVRTLKGERRNVMSTVKKNKDNPTFVREWLEKYYQGDHQAFMQKNYRGPMTALSEAILPIVAEAVDIDPDEVGVSKDVEIHLEKFSVRESVHSLYSLIEIMDDLRSYRDLEDNEYDDYEDAFNSQFDDWEEGRSGTIANWETTRIDGMTTKSVFLAVGVTYLVWAAGVNACPFCSALDGMKVGIDSPFVASGDSVEAGGESMSVSWNVMTPPVHNGCACSIEAG